MNDAPPPPSSSSPSAAPQRRRVDGPVGPIELLVDAPRGEPVGTVLVAHPQPLLGGSADHKIPQLLARAARDLGWLAVRPNFRGVGGTAGTHDHGVGETEDLLAVVDALRVERPWAPLALVGFSFGAWVQARVATRLAADGRPAAAVALAGMPVGTVDTGRHYEVDTLPPGTLVVHGEHDDRVRLAAVLDWAAASGQPVTVVPATDHFFKGRLPVLRGLVETALRAASR
ncbi:MAG: alpha/beta hydrolase [Burkholderiales bacterium]